MTAGLPNSILVDVPVVRLERLLGVPPAARHCPQWPSLVDGAQCWCREHVTPWVRTRHVMIARIAGDVVELEPGIKLTSNLLASGLRAVRAHALIVAAFSAGHEIDEEVKKLWDDSRPDEAMVLNAYGGAMIEELRELVARCLRQTLGARGMRVLPYLSPGYDGWPLEDQANLFSLIADVAGPIELLDSGGLRPSKSTLAVFGLTCADDVAASMHDFWTSQTSTHAANAAETTSWRVLARGSRLLHHGCNALLTARAQ